MLNDKGDNIYLDGEMIFYNRIQVNKDLVSKTDLSIEDIKKIAYK